MPRSRSLSWPRQTSFLSHLKWTPLVSLTLACSAPLLSEDPGGVFFIVNGPDAVASLGDTIALQVAIKDPVARPVRGTIEWSSSEPSVATVNPDGVVTTRRLGAAVVTASYLTYQAHLTVHASGPEESAVASAVIEPEEAELRTGETIQVSVVFRDDNGQILGDVPVTWISTNESVATVQDGRVTAVGPGSASLTAAGGGKSAAMVLTVTAAEGGGGAGGGGGSPGAVDPFRAFPEAAGYGAEALMECDRRTVQVLRVTTTAGNGPGSLSDVLSRVDGDRLTVVIFRQGGTHFLDDPGLSRGCLYIAGQTAPGGGAQIYNPFGANALNVDRSGGASDLVVRFLRFRSSKGTPGQQDVVSIGGGRDMIFDHVSAQFGNDEVFSINPIVLNGSSVSNVTISNSLIAVGLVPHSTGSLIISSEQDPSITTSNVSLHHNLWAHNHHRNPWVKGVERIQIVNNVMYNWKGNVGKITGGTSADVIGNTFRAGPWTFNNQRESRIFHHDTVGALSSVFIEGNVAQPLQPSATGDQRIFVKYQAGGGVIPAQAFVSSRLTAPRFGVQEEAAAAAFERVMDDVGASRRLACNGDWTSARDVLDAEIVSHVQSASGPGVDEGLDHPDDFGGAPTLATGTPCGDRDEDGMPDAFEDRYGFDLADPTDVSGDPDGDGYTNIEEYVNGTVPR